MYVCVQISMWLHICTYTYICVGTFVDKQKRKRKESQTELAGISEDYSVLRMLASRKKHLGDEEIIIQTSFTSSGADGILKSL